MEWLLYSLLGLVSAFGAYLIVRSFMPRQSDPREDDLVNYTCNYCRDGLEGSYAEQVCPECGRQLDPFMNS